MGIHVRVSSTHHSGGPSASGGGVLQQGEREGMVFAHLTLTPKSLSLIRVPVCARYRGQQLHHALVVLLLLLHLTYVS